MRNVSGYNVSGDPCCKNQPGLGGQEPHGYAGHHDFYVPGAFFLLIDADARQ